MQVTVEEVSTTRRTLAIEVSPERVRREIDEAFGKVQRQAQIKGFRPGKVPRAVLERHFGSQVRAEAMSHVIEESFGEALEQSGLRPISSPEIVPEAIEEGKPLRYRATIDVRPLISISEWKGLPARRPVREMTEVDVDEAIDRIRDSLAELRPVEDRTTPTTGEFVVLDYVATKDGQPLTEGSKENRVVQLGAGALPPEMELALGAMEVGQSRSVTVQFPAEWGDAELAGQAVDFHITLRGIREKVLPPADDDLAREHGESETLVELRTKLRGRLQESWRKGAENHVRDQILDEFLRRTPFDVPKMLVDRQGDMLLEDALARSGRSVESLRAEPELLDKLRAEVRPRAEQQIRAVLALEALASEQSIEILEADVEKRIEELVAQAGTEADKLRAAYRGPEHRADLKARLSRERAVDLLVAVAAIEDVAPGDVVAPPDQNG